MSKPTPATQPYEPRFAAERQRRRALLEKVQLYERLYPGGPQGDAAVRIEFDTLFEIASADTGDFVPLKARVAECLRRPPTQSALPEAAYWDIRCRQLDRPASQPATQPTGPVGALDDSLRVRYQEYLTRFPESRHAPHSCEVLFADAVRRDDRAALKQLVDLARRHFPDHPTTQHLSGRLWRVEAIGQPFAVEFEALDERKVDTSRWRGNRVRVIVWSADEPGSAEPLSRLEREAAAHADLHVCGVALDGEAERVRAICTERKLYSPQWCVGFAESAVLRGRWGIEALPLVLEIDDRGQLASVTDATPGPASGAAAAEKPRGP